MTAVDVTFSELIDRSSISQWDMGVVDLNHPQTSQLGYYDFNGSSNFDSLSKCVVVGNRLYAATSQGLQILDVSTPSTPTLLRSYGTPGWAYGVAVVNGLAYVADYEAGLRILDVSDPLSDPVKDKPSYLNPWDKDYANNLVGRYDTPGQARNVEIVGDYAYVADNGGGLQIIDVSTPSTSHLEGYYQTPGHAYSVDVVNGLAYVGQAIKAVCRLIAVTDPRNPILVRFLCHAKLCTGRRGCRRSRLRRGLRRSSDHRCFSYTHFEGLLRFAGLCDRLDGCRQPRLLRGRRQRRAKL